MPDPEPNSKLPPDFRGRLVKAFQESGVGLQPLIEELKRGDQAQALKELLIGARVPEVKIETLFRAFDFLTSKLLPASVVTAHLLQLESSSNIDLLCDLIVAGLAPEQGAHTGYASRSLNFTGNLLDETRKRLKTRFGALPLSVWQRAKHERMRADWCRAWAVWAKDVIDLALRAPDAGKNSIRVDAMLRGISEAAPESADAMLGLTATLTRVSESDDGTLDVLRTSRLGIAMRRRVEWLFAQPSETAGDTRAQSAEITAAPNTAAPAINAPQAPGVLPESIRAQLDALTKSLENFAAGVHQQVPAAENDPAILKVKTELEERTEELHKLREFVASLRESRERDREALERERVRAASLAAENKSLSARTSDIERAFQRSKDEAEKFRKSLEDERTIAKHDLEQARMDFRASMEMRVEDIWMQVGDAVDVVVKKEREPHVLIGPWNSLNLAFWDSFGKPGRPVKKP